MRVSREHYGDWWYVLGPGLDDPVLVVKRGYQGNPNMTEAVYPIVSDGRGQLIAVADTNGEFQGNISNMEYDAGLWNSSGLTAAAQTFDPRRQTMAGGAAPISTFRARQYDPATGKWLQEDPIGLAGGTNLYEYNGNDPNSFSDPMGLLSSCKDANSKTVDCPEPSGGPPVGLPVGKNGLPNSWVVVAGSGKRTKYAPKYPVPSEKGSQPQASWDKEGHWDVDNLGGPGRRRFNEKGEEVSHDGEPIHPARSEPSAMKTAGAIGTATLLYWIISESSRILFPPRNLIPAP